MDAPYSFAPISRQTGLVDKVRAKILQAHVPPVDQLDLSAVAFAFPNDLDGYHYILERAMDRQIVGRVEAGIGGMTDDLTGYLCTVLSTGMTFEAALYREAANTWIIYREGALLGECRCSGADALRDITSVVWELVQGDSVWGSIEAGWYVAGSLSIKRPDGRLLPLVLSDGQHLWDFVIVLIRLVTFCWLWIPPPANRDLVIPAHSDLESFSDADRAFYFINSIIFRVLIYRRGYGAGG